MRCEAVAEALSAARDTGFDPDAAVRAHLESCAGCRAMAENFAALERALAADEPEPPGPGFDTRFFARLEERKGGGRRRRWVWAAAVIPVAAAVLLLVNTGDSGTPRGDDLELTLNLEMIEDMALLRRLEEVEAFEELSDLELSDIEAVGEQRP